MSVSDFVVRDGSVGVACLLEDEELFTLLKLYELVQQVSPNSARYCTRGDHVVAPASNLEQSVAWYWSGDSEVTVLWK